MAVQVVGLDALQRAFRAADKEVARDLRDALEEAASPVRADAQLLAPSIRNLAAGDPWTRMRVGTTRSIVYVAPVERGIKGRGNQRKRRRNFKDLLLRRALEPALERNIPQVTRRVDEMLVEVSKVWERTI